MAAWHLRPSSNAAFVGDPLRLAIDGLAAPTDFLSKRHTTAYDLFQLPRVDNSDFKAQSSNKPLQCLILIPASGQLSYFYSDGIGEVIKSPSNLVDS